jgi:hypothetical protein
VAVLPRGCGLARQMMAFGYDLYVISSRLCGKAAQFSVD